MYVCLRLKFNSDLCNTGTPRHWSSNGFKTRWRLWLHDHSSNETCRGGFVNNVCSYGVDDLPMIARSKQMFANKLHLERNPMAFRCLEFWYQSRATMHMTTTTSVDFQFYALQ